MITDEEARHTLKKCGTGTHEKEQIHEDEFHIAKDSKRKSREIYFLGLQSHVLSISVQEVVNVLSLDEFKQHGCPGGSLHSQGSSGSSSA